jgi:hypothetical protein
VGVGRIDRGDLDHGDGLVALVIGGVCQRSHEADQRSFNLPPAM